MRVIAFNGSPNRRGNTFIMLRRCLDVMEAEGIETELIHIGDSLHPCRGCNACRNGNLGRCFLDDPLNDWFDKITRAEGLLLGSPTYFWGMHPSMKSLVDRTGYLARGRLRAGENRNALFRKVGAALAVDGYSGAPQTVQAMQTLFMVTQMIVPGAAYWPIAKGAGPGDAARDADGMRYVEDLGRQMAWLIKKLNA